MVLTNKDNQEMEKILGFIPVNDGTIFVNDEGKFKERIGIEFCEDDEYGEFSRFIDKNGIKNDLPENNEYKAIIGTKGDTVTLRDISVAFQYSSYPRLVVKKAEEYFTVVKDNLPDTVKFSFDTTVYGDNCARLDVITDEFPRLGLQFFDLSEEDYRIKDERNRRTLEDVLITVLHAYADVIGKRPNVEIYIKKEDRDYIDKDELESSRKRIEYLEEQYLPRLRRYVNEKLDEAIKMDEEQERENKALKECRDKILKGSLTKYDFDPNMY